MTHADAWEYEGKWRLGFHVKQSILMNNIYGVDIDERAVETTMLSLYMKLMEDEILAHWSRASSFYPIFAIILSVVTALSDPM
jgi:hypothetical protein